MGEARRRMGSISMLTSISPTPGAGPVEAGVRSFPPFIRPLPVSELYPPLPPSPYHDSQGVPVRLEDGT